MIDVYRVIEQQANLSSYRATQNEERALQLELLIETSKPTNLNTAWHPLISTPFRYSAPHPEARFRPPHGRNVFYSSLNEETSLFEHAYHYMKQRIHLSYASESGIRSIFSVKVNNNNATDIKYENNRLNILNKNDYSASHQFILANPNSDFILYPSCRDPNKRYNAAILSIKKIEKNPSWESLIKFFYDNKKQQISWIGHNLHISWQQVN